MEKLILIDGNAILYRAYHALPPLSKDGVVVNAVYGFFGMFLKILEEQKPSHVVVCFDRPKPTFRQALFAGYHQNRPAMADDLIPQVGIVHDVLEKTKVTIFEVDGYEADDIIGTIAFQATSLKTQKSKLKSQNIETIIVSGDRDMLQLVNPQVKVLMPITGISKMVLMGEDEVEEKYGVKSSQFIDYKALIGDTSDNYPGVTGIGPKTASQLLQKYHSFENLYQHLADLPEKQALMLATDAEQAALAKKLATIVTDAPITLNIKEASVTHFDFKATEQAFEALGIKSLQKRLPQRKVENVEEVGKVEKGKEKNDQLELL